MQQDNSLSIDNNMQRKEEMLIVTEKLSLNMLLFLPALNPDKA